MLCWISCYVMISDLMKFSWRDIFAGAVDVNEMYETFSSILFNYMRIHANVSRGAPSAGRLPKEIQSLKTKINVAFQNGRPYDRLQKRLEKCIFRARRIEECKIVATHNRRKVFSYVKKRIKVKDDMDCLRRYDGTLATDEDEKAAILADYFASTYPAPEVICARAGLTPEECRVNDVRTFVNDVDLSPATIYRALCELPSKFSSTPENIPCIVYKNCASALAEPLSLVLERSFEDGVVPKLFTEAFVCPVHKGGDKSDKCNKRPVSLTVVPCKVIVKLICKAIHRNADVQLLFSTEQYAYSPGMSTIDQWIDTQNEIL